MRKHPPQTCCDEDVSVQFGVSSHREPCRKWRKVVPAKATGLGCASSKDSSQRDPPKRAGQEQEWRLSAGRQRPPLRQGPGGGPQGGPAKEATRSEPLERPTRSVQASPLSTRRWSAPSRPGPRGPASGLRAASGGSPPRYRGCSRFSSLSGPCGRTVQQWSRE